MAFEFNEEAAMASTGPVTVGKVLDTGVYDVVINTASKDTAGTGTTGITWNFTVDGAKYPNTIYGFWTNKANGEKIFNLDTLMALMGIIGAKSLTEYDKTIEVKDGTKQVTAYKELDGVRCKIAVQKVLDVYNGEVTEKNEIKAFLSEEGKTYAEAVRGAPAKQLEYYSTKMQDKHTSDYKAYLANGEGDAEETSTESLL